MAPRRNTPLTRQAVLEAYAAWLKARGLARSPITGGAFAREVTNAGRERFDGLSEEDVCVIVGGDQRKG